ncbi:MAG: type I phosphomannose isomerase catalytic subunit [Hyphomicrobiales bacterium]
MNELYPLKFKPIHKYKIWGGQKIKNILNQDTKDITSCGESWVLSGVENNNSVVSNGFLEGNSLNELVAIYMGDLVGEKVFDKFGSEFPILVKFLDAKDWLSIQVHPDDDLAQKRGLEMGKTEMWYVVEADENAQLISGFKKNCDQETYLHYLNNGKIKELLNVETVKAGEVFYIPAGRVHALGPGSFVAEIQQTSDTTYRIYDWDRIGVDGLKRELHTEQALAAINYKAEKEYKTEYTPTENKTVDLVESPYFTTNKLDLSGKIEKDFSEIDSFIIYVCTKGNAIFEFEGGKEQLSIGETLLIPNQLEGVTIESNKGAELLEVYILNK